MSKIPTLALAVFSAAAWVGYSAIGTEGRVDTIKELAPASISERGWEIIRYEGYQRGSWSSHGGKVWYHVKNTDQSDIQYRVYITLWNGELHYHYDAPEKLHRVNLNIDKL